jgi:hypothetical protein
MPDPVENIQSTPSEQRRIDDDEMRLNAPRFPQTTRGIGAGTDDHVSVILQQIFDQPQQGCGLHGKQHFRSWQNAAPAKRG